MRDHLKIFIDGRRTDPVGVRSQSGSEKRPGTQEILGYGATGTAD